MVSFLNGFVTDLRMGMGKSWHKNYCSRSEVTVKLMSFFVTLYICSFVHENELEK